MLGKVLSCEKKQFEDKVYFKICVIVNGVVGFLNSNTDFKLGSDVELVLKTDKNNRFILSF